MASMSIPTTSSLSPNKACRDLSCLPTRRSSIQSIIERSRSQNYAWTDEIERTVNPGGQLRRGRQLVNPASIKSPRDIMAWACKMRGVDPALLGRDKGTETESQACKACGGLWSVYEYNHDTTLRHMVAQACNLWLDVRGLLMDRVCRKCAKYTGMNDTASIICGSCRAKQGQLKAGAKKNNYLRGKGDEEEVDELAEDEMEEYELDEDTEDEDTTNVQRKPHEIAWEAQIRAHEKNSFNENRRTELEAESQAVRKGKGPAASAGMVDPSHTMARSSYTGGELYCAPGLSNTRITQEREYTRTPHGYPLRSEAPDIPFSVALSSSNENTHGQNRTSSVHNSSLASISSHKVATAPPLPSVLTSRGMMFQPPNLGEGRRWVIPDRGDPYWEWTFDPPAHPSPYHQDNLRRYGLRGPGIPGYEHRQTEEEDVWQDRPQVRDTRAVDHQGDEGMLVDDEYHSSAHMFDARPQSYYTESRRQLRRNYTSSQLPANMQEVHSPAPQDYRLSTVAMHDRPVLAMAHSQGPFMADPSPNISTPIYPDLPDNTQQTHAANYHDEPDHCECSHRHDCRPFHLQNGLPTHQVDFPVAPPPPRLLQPIPRHASSIIQPHFSLL
ncbi:hypothetical protein BDW22DRAFT_1358147 [Trametopsis cervina]|nr:hypothetical protein BDW22DRAFT_1358147 [Trametopsis cervina]